MAPTESYFSPFDNIQEDLGSLAVADSLPPFSVVINGPDYIASAGPYTWEANVVGEDDSYQWYRRTKMVTTTCSYITN
jgi:hypothetical protein